MCMAKYARTTSKLATQLVYEEAARAQRQFEADSARHMSLQTGDVPAFARGYLVMWALFAAIALPLSWFVAKYASTYWFLPGLPEFAVSLALISAMFGRRYASTEAMTVTFMAAFAFGAGLERGLFGITGLIVAILGGLALASLVGVGVWALINVAGARSGLVNPYEPDQLPPSLPMAWRSMLTVWVNREFKLRRGALVIGPMLGVGVALHTIALLGAWALGPDSFAASDWFNVVARALVGLAAGLLLGWLLQQFIPDKRPKGQ
jgi:hypothetical protein